MPLLLQLEDDIVHEAHALADAGLHRVPETGGLALLDEVADGGVVDEDLAGEDESLAGGGGQEAASVGVDGTTYRVCRRCKGTGKAVTR